MRETGYHCLHCKGQEGGTVSTKHCMPTWPLGSVPDDNVIVYGGRGQPHISRGPSHIQDVPLMAPQCCHTPPWLNIHHIRAKHCTTCKSNIYSDFYDVKNMPKGDRKDWIFCFIQKEKEVLVIRRKCCRKTITIERYYRLRVLTLRSLYAKGWSWVWGLVYRSSNM